MRVVEKKIHVNKSKKTIRYVCTFLKIKDIAWERYWSIVGELMFQHRLIRNNENQFELVDLNKQTVVNTCILCIKK